MTDKQMKEKWEEVLTYATEHATGKGMHTGVRWLEDSFNEYLTMSDEAPGYGMGGQPGSMHNRQVLAGKVVLALGSYVGGRHVLDDQQIARLKESLQGIVDNARQERGMRL